MANLLEETKEILEQHGKAFDDVFLSEMKPPIQK